MKRVRGGGGEAHDNCMIPTLPLVQTSHTVHTHNQLAKGNVPVDLKQCCHYSIITVVLPYYCVRSLHHCQDDALLSLLLDKSVPFTLLNK